MFFYGPLEKRKICDRNEALFLSCIQPSPLRFCFNFTHRERYDRMCRLKNPRKLLRFFSDFSFCMNISFFKWGYLFIFLPS